MCGFSCGTTFFLDEGDDAGRGDDPGEADGSDADAFAVTLERMWPVPISPASTDSMAFSRTRRLRNAQVKISL